MKTPAGIFTRRQGQEGGLRMQPRKKVELQVLGNKNTRGGEQGETPFCQRLGAIRWNLYRDHNP